MDKYTRYSFKKRKKYGNIFPFIVFAIAIILIIGGRMVNNTNKYKTQIKQNNLKKQTKEKKQIRNFYIIQCGVFSNKENAEKIKASINNYGQPFIIKEDDKFKLILGIYEKDKCMKIMDQLNKNKIDSVKFKIDIKIHDLCDMEIVEIISGELKIIDRLCEEDVEYIRTEKFKKWLNSLEKCDDGKNYQSLCFLKEKANKFPEKLVKDHISNVYIDIYEILKKMK